MRRCTIRAGAPDQRGVGIAAEADTVMSGNVVEDAEVYGIALGTGSFTRNVVATGNVVMNLAGSPITTEAGIAVSGVSDAGHQLVVGNMVQMKAGRGAAYGLVAVDYSGSIIMSGPDRSRSTPPTSRK